MTQSAPLLTSNSTILWLKVILTTVSLVLLSIRYRSRNALGASAKTYSFRAKVFVVLTIIFSFAVFHDLGKPRSGTFIHYGEMFHYYLGSKYFKELGYYELYNAVIVADAEQDNALARLPFYTNLTNYQNARRETALEGADRVKNLFSKERWSAFKRDVSFFKTATGMPRSSGIFFFLMDHGYNASPVSTSVLGILTNIVPVTQLRMLAALDVLLVAAMIALVFRTFGFEMGALFSIYFFTNILNDHGYISGSLLRYDWLFCIIASVCLLERGRYASSSFFLTASAMMAVFPVVLFYGVGVSIVRRVKTTRTLDRDSIRFVLTAGVTGLALFLLPAVYLGSALQPWTEFSAKMALHDRGVYVNHLGLRGIVLFETSHLSLNRFIETYNDGSGDIVRHWQDVKEREFEQRKPIIIFCSIFALICVTAIVWKRKESEIEAILWPVLLIYVMSYPSHYYYVFLCLFILLFFRRGNSLTAFVPICLLLIFNICALITDSFSPSPIVFYTLVNIYLFVCMVSILVFELRTNVFRRRPQETVARSARGHVAAKRGRSKRKQKTSRRACVSGDRSCYAAGSRRLGRREVAGNLSPLRSRRRHKNERPENPRAIPGLVRCSTCLQQMWRLALVLGARLESCTVNSPSPARSVRLALIAASTRAC